MPPFRRGVWVHTDALGDGAPQTRLFWLPDYDPGVLRVDAEPVPPSDPEAFDIADYMTMADLVLDRLGHEFLLLDDGQHQIELQVVRGTLADGPVRLRCELQMFSGLDAKLLTLSRLTAFRRLKRFPKTLFPVEARAPKWAAALQAYDGMIAGASLREIAIAVFSARLVAEEWSGGGSFLKSRVQRLLHFGRKMVDGDYKTLLQ